MKLSNDAERARWMTFVGSQTLPLDVECKAWRKSRTNEQNNLLFGVFYPPIAEAMGYPVGGDNGIHAFMCGTHFGWVDVRVPKTPRNPEGIASEPLRSTTREGWHHGRRSVLTTIEFSKFLDTVDRVAAQAQVHIPATDRIERMAEIWVQERAA